MNANGLSAVSSPPMKTSLRLFLLAAFAVILVGTASAHYNPQLGRWLSRDPLGEAGGFNLYAYCGNDPVNGHDPLGLNPHYWVKPNDSAEFTLFDFFSPYTASEMRGGRSPWGGNAGALEHSRNVTMPLLKITAAGGYGVAALPMAAPIALEVPTAAGISDLALKSYVTLQNSSLAQGTLRLLAGYHVFNFATNEEYRGQTISIDGGTGFSSVGLAATDLLSAGRSLLTLPRLNPANYDWNPFFAPLRGGFLYSGVPVPGIPAYRGAPVMSREAIINRLGEVLDLSSIRELDPAARVGIRGGMARGFKSSHRGGGPFDPSDFDIDAFIVSDELAALFPKQAWWRNAAEVGLGEFQTNFDATLRVLPEFQGLRSSPLSFRIFTTDEINKKLLGGDTQIFFIGN
jgi:hypothetical protein